MSEKFMAWDTKRKKMWSAEEMGRDQLTLSPDGRGFVNVSGTSTRLSRFCSNLIPLRFTGKYDLNGFEIYKGMILDCNVGVSGQNKRVKVLVKSGCPCHVFPNGQLYVDGRVQAIIIGNEFENLKLLKETQ